MRNKSSGSREAAPNQESQMDEPDEETDGGRFEDDVDEVTGNRED